MRLHISGVLVGLVVLGALIACTSNLGTPDEESLGAVPTRVPGKILTIGDISDEPIIKIERFLPLADHLASNLADMGYGSGHVVIAQSMDEMGALLKSGEVDVFMDSAYPSLLVQQLSQSRFLLRRWKGGDSSYWSVFAVNRDLDIEDVEGLRGHVIAAEDPYSTSGYALPVTELISRGVDVKIVGDSHSIVSDDAVGVWFTRDEANTLDAIHHGTVVAGFLSNQDVSELDPGDQYLKVIGRTDSVPRQIVSVSLGVSREVADRIQQILQQLSDSVDGRSILDHVNTAKFDEIPDGDLKTLTALASAIEFLP